MEDVLLVDNKRRMLQEEKNFELRKTRPHGANSLAHARHARLAALREDDNLANAGII